MKNKVKKIYKYPTGATIPDGAIYLSTVTQGHEVISEGSMYAKKVSQPCWFVWHYFLVEVEE